MFKELKENYVFSEGEETSEEKWNSIEILQLKSKIIGIKTTSQGSPFEFLQTQFLSFKRRLMDMQGDKIT